MAKKNILVLITLILSGLIFAGAADLKAQQKLAVDYFVKLTTGDLAGANELVTAPYTLDLKKVLKTKDEVLAFHEQMLKKKGKREVPKYSVAVTQEAVELDSKVFPAYTAFRIKIEGHGHLDIYVTNTKDPKVIGFAD